VSCFGTLEIRCIRVLTTEISGKFPVASTRTLGRGEETFLSSGWTLIGSELSYPNFNSSVRTERSLAIRYLNAVIKPLCCGNLDICLINRLTPTFGCGILFAYFRLMIVTESERCSFGSRLSVTILRNLADFATDIYFGREKPELANAPIM